MFGVAGNLYVQKAIIIDAFRRNNAFNIENAKTIIELKLKNPESLLNPKSDNFFQYFFKLGIIIPTDDGEFYLDNQKSTDHMSHKK